MIPEIKKAYRIYGKPYYLIKKFTRPFSPPYVYVR